MPMLNASKLYSLLLTTYGEPRWWSDDPYTVMFQAVLVQNTAWENVEKTSASIGENLNPETIYALRQEELERLIKPCGFFKAKARTIRALTEWYGRYNCSREKTESKTMNELREELLSIKGIGEETADVILVYALYRPSFIVDAYTRRFLRRFGYSFQNDEEIRKFFTSLLSADAKDYGHFHWLLLDHGKTYCRKKPLCSFCPLIGLCKQKED